MSLANFAAPILVGRYGGQEELGFFALGFSIYMFAIGMARATVWTAFTRRTQQLEPAERPACAGSATVHLGVFLAAALLTTLAVAAALAAIGYPQYATLLAIVAPCTAALLVREHVRRLDLARLAFREVFAFDLVVATAQVLLLAWLASSGRMSATTAFLSLATTSLLAIPWMLFRRAGSWRIVWADVLPDWSASWSITKWLTGGATAVLLGNQGYRWLLSAIASIAELGRLGAAQVVVQLTNPLVIGGSNYLGPTSAKVLADEGVAGLWRFTVRTSGVMLAAILGFLTLVATAGLPFVQLIFQDAAEGVTTRLLVLFSAGALSEALLIPIEFASVNLGHGRLMFHTAIIRLAINGTLGFGLVGVFGAEAIGVGMLLGSSVAIGWQWAAFAREARGA